MSRVFCSICGQYVPIGEKRSNHRTKHLIEVHGIPFSPGFVAYWFLEASEYVDDTILIHCKKNLQDPSTEVIFNTIPYTGMMENDFWFDRLTVDSVLKKLKEMGLIYFKGGFVKTTALGKQVKDYLRFSND